MRRLLICALIAGVTALAQDDAHQQDRDALRAILAEIEKAINAQDIEAMIAQMDPQCTVTWWNAEVSHGHDEIRAYYRKMVKDEGRILDKYMTRAKLGGPARFLGSGGDIAIADGSTEDEFFPVIRSSFKLDSRWSATVAKSAGQWKIVNLHLSANVFTNQLIAELTRLLWIAGIGGLLVGALLGWFGRRFISSRPRDPERAR